MASADVRPADDLPVRPRPAAAAAALAAVLESLAAIVLGVLAAVVLWAVIQRYLFGAGLVWSDELAVWLHGGLVAFGAPLAATHRLALRFDVILRWMPARAQAVGAVLGDALVVHGALVLALGGSQVARLLGGTSTVLALPEWLRFAPVAAGGALAVMAVGLTAWRDRGAVAALAALTLGVSSYGAPGWIGPVDLVRPSLLAAALAATGVIIGAPLPFVLLSAATVAGVLGGTLPEPAVVQTAVAGISKFLLLAIPFFLLAGELLTSGGLARRLVRFAASLVGHWRAGLAQTTLAASVMFSGASGSSIANAAFGAKVMAPELVARGYPPAHAGAIVAAVSVLDNIIPPSIAFLILAAATNLSVGGLLTGGFIAGGILAVALAIGIHLTASGVVDTAPRASASERWSAFLAALPALGLGLVVVFGIRAGLATTTEASALAVAYALVTCLALRSLGLRDVWAALRRSAGEAAVIGLLIAATAPFAFLLAVDRVADLVASATTALGGGPLAVMLLANLVLLVAGLVLDVGAAILLLAPLLLPVAVAAGLDGVQFGVVLVVNLMIHGLTPPLGILVYVVSGVMGTPAAAIFRAVLPLLGTLLVALAILALGAALWPGIV